MRRHVKDDSPSAGNDSFLDIVANMVGILIILVMVVGVRTRHAPLVAATTPPPETPTEDLHSIATLGASIERDVVHLAKAISDVRRQTAIRSLERGELAFAVHEGRGELEKRRSALDARERETFDVARRLAHTESALNAGLGELDRLESIPEQVVRVESYPTPLAKVVDGRETHFQLRGKRIAHIPLDELLSKLKQQAQGDISRLRNSPEVSDTIGPIGGFRMRYTFQRVQISGSGTLRGAPAGTYARLGHWDLIPTSRQLGETLEEAKAPNSNFRSAVSRLDPRRSTITLWTYPDTFDEFRALRKELHRQGYAVAGRPLPHRVPIGGSPYGSKSAAQ